MRETGYFLPHVPISYLSIVFVAFLTWLVLHFVVGLESDFFLLGLIVVVAAAFSVWSNRYMKMVWLLIDLWLHPPTREDYESRGRE